jgi:hypothetical protein
LALIVVNSWTSRISRFAQVFLQTFRLSVQPKLFGPPEDRVGGGMKDPGLREVISTSRDVWPLSWFSFMLSFMKRFVQGPWAGQRMRQPRSSARESFVRSSRLAAIKAKHPNKENNKYGQIRQMKGLVFPKSIFTKT